MTQNEGLGAVVPFSFEGARSDDVFMAGMGLATETNQLFAAFRWNDSHWKPIFSGAVNRNYFH